ncbi:MAG: 2-oxo acid dehydrogenase subunit E2, partial [Deltaproteobacteria bacterium]|nr:2-oxo acid dehydrogenase subunit E2 [Deltaproteobacteria bacterium]
MSAPQINPGEISNWPLLKIRYRTDAEKIAALLPPGIDPGDEPNVSLNIYNVPVPDEPEALAVNESDTIGSEAVADLDAVVKELDAAAEPVKLDETTVAQIIEQSVSEPRGKSVKVRRLVARKMQQSWQHAPHFFVTVAVDMTDVIRFRADLGVTINDFILAATTRALQEHPWVNSHFVDDEAVEQSAIN